MCMSACYMYVWASSACLVHTGQKGHGIPWNWSSRWVWTLRCWQCKPGCLARALSTLSHWSPLSSNLTIFKCEGYQGQMGAGLENPWAIFHNLIGRRQIFWCFLLWNVSPCVHRCNVLCVIHSTMNFYPQL